MKTKLFFTLAVSIFLTCTKAQTTFNKEFFPWKNTCADVNPWASANTADGGYIMGGYMNGSFIAPGSKPFMIRTDANGDTLWTRIYSIDIADNACIFSVNEDQGGNIVACGSLIDTANGFSFSVFVMKVNTSGNIMWVYSYSLSNDTTYLERGESIKATSDGGYVVAGDIYKNGGYDAFLLKLDNGGNVQWSKVFAGSTSESFYSVVQTSDGGYAASGETNSFDPNGNSTACLVKTNSVGDTLWTKNYQIPETFIAWMTAQTSDGGFILSLTDYAANTEAALIKTNASGNVMWAKTYGEAGSDCSYWAVEIAGGGYAIAGTTSSFNDAVHGNYFLVKTNASGQIIWSKEYGGTGPEEGYMVQTNSIGGFNVFGYSNSSNPYSSVYLVSTDALGNGGGCDEYNVTAQENVLAMQTEAAPFGISSGVIKTTRTGIVDQGGSFGNCCNSNQIVTASKQKQFSLSPNPSKCGGAIKIEQNICDGELRVYNMLGETVKIIPNVKKGETGISLTGIEKGMYLFSLVGEEKVIFSGKLLVE